MMRPTRLLPILAALLVAVASLAFFTQRGDAAPAVTVYKSPTCGCCAKWVDHLREAGFEVSVTDMPDVAPMKTRLGVPGNLGACHTAVVDGYVVEGHVPADVVRKMLQERPDITGIAVPGMPMGSPGMEGSYTEPYDVVAFRKNGPPYVFASRN